MYNGIGLTTPRGSGTNGHVQRNWAFVRPGKKDNCNYRSEEDIKKLDATLNRPPNKDILDHDRKRKIEVKCLEFEEILEKQGLSSDEIKTKVESYRTKLMGQGKSDVPKDEFGRISVRDSHQLAEAQQEKNAKLREAFNISEYFVEGSSFDSDRKAKEDIAKSLALQKELDAQRDQTAAAAAKEKESSKRYALVRTPSIEHDLSTSSIVGAAPDNSDNTFKKKKKKKMRESSGSPERKKDKKKKSKKRKKESKPKKSKKLRRRKSSEPESNADNDKESIDETEIDPDVKKIHKKSKRDKKKRRNKKKVISSSSDKSRSPSPLDIPITTKKCEYRSRSKEKAHKSKESETGRYESSYSICGSRNSQKNRNRSRMRSTSSSDNNLVSRRTERNDNCTYDSRNLNLKELSRSRDFRSCERKNLTCNIKNLENRRSRSQQRSKREITDEHFKSLKRKHDDKHYQKIKDQSPNADKRKRYSQLHSSSTNRQSRDRICLSKTSETKSSSYKRRSRTPHQETSDNQSRVKKYRSRSYSMKESLRNKSLTPLPRTCKRTESLKHIEDISNNQEKLGANNRTCKDKSKVYKKSRSRTTSSCSKTTSSTDIRRTKSRSLSPKTHDIEDSSPFKNLNMKSIKETRNSPSPIRASTPTKMRLASTSQSRYVFDDRKRKYKQRSNSITNEGVKNSKEKGERRKLISRTPPPKIQKPPKSPTSSRHSSELSYSPARRNPERYQDIIENIKDEKGKDNDSNDAKREYEWDRKDKIGKNDRNQAKPVVRLHSQSDEESDAIERNTEKMLDEFQEFKGEKELKEFKMLEHLKTGLAAKAKEKIKTIEKMAASTSANLSSNIEGEVSDNSYKRTVRNSLNDFLTANNVATAVVATCSAATYSSVGNSPPGAIYPQSLEEIKKEQRSVLQLTENSNHIENYKERNMDNETQVNCKKSLVTANGHTLLISPTMSPLHNNANAVNKEKDRKRERDFRERERESYNFNKDRYLERRQKTSPNFYSTGGGGIGGGTISGANVGGSRRSSNNSTPNLNHRQRLNMMCNSVSVGTHHHPHAHLYQHHHHSTHKMINNHHNSASSSSTFYLTNNSSTNPHILTCSHSNNSNISFNRPSRINNTPLITATQFNNQMLSKQSNSILVNRRDHRTALNLGLSGTPCTNFSNSNLLLTKANTNSHHLHAAAVGHVAGGGHHHQHHYHHHHHHGQSTSMSSGGNNPATQITDRILMAASIAAAQRHSLGVHSAVSSAAAVAAANNLNFLHQQNKPKLAIKPFKINDSQPLVAALADSSLVDAIVSKVSTATVAAAESAARRSRSRSRRSQSRYRHQEKTSGASSSGACGGERAENRHRSASHSRSSRSSTSSRSRSRSHSHRSSRSHSTQSSSSSQTSSRSSSSSSFGSSRSGTRSLSIPRRRGSPSFLDRRRITSRHSSIRDRRH